MSNYETQKHQPHHICDGIDPTRGMGSERIATLCFWMTKLKTDIIHMQCMKYIGIIFSTGLTKFRTAQQSIIKWMRERVRECCRRLKWIGTNHMTAMNEHWLEQKKKKSKREVYPHAQENDGKKSGTNLKSSHLLKFSYDISVQVGDGDIYQPAFIVVSHTGFT